MTLAEYDTYINTVNEIEERIDNDNKYPVVNDNAVKKCCHYTLEMTKLILKYLKYNIGHEKKE